MQTHFSEEQLADPATARSNAVLRSCVHCGFCTATCPTFVLRGDELDSPRGRIYLIKAMLEGGEPATEEVVRHVDRCLSCLSCMTTCPSGVNYMHLVDHARAYIEQSYQRPWHDRALRAVLALVLPRPGLFRLALMGAWLARPFAGVVRGRSVLAQRVRAMLELAPNRLPAPDAACLPGAHRAVGAQRMRVALLAGCAQSVLAPSINAATIRLLTRLGVEVVVARGAGCCGALTHHMGREAEAQAAAQANILAWEQAGVERVVINTSGCGTTVKNYGHLLGDLPGDWGARGADMAARAVDISTLLEELGYAATRPPAGLRVAYHAACSLQHGQKITAAPKNLLRRAGFEVVEPRDAHLCCGSAGTYNILQPEFAGALRARKLESIAPLRADVIAAGNIGCLMQLRGGVPAVHTVELLDWMAGGPKPEGLA